MEITITEEDALNSLAEFQTPLPVKGVPKNPGFVIGSLCLDNPLSKAIAGNLAGRSVVSLCDGTIRVDYKGQTHRLSVPKAYQRFDELFCAVVYASRTRSKKSKLKASTAQAEMMRLLPMTVSV